MENSEKRYYVRVTNPNKGTHKLLRKLNGELSLIYEEFWQKRDDPAVTISTKPVYVKSFDHVVSLYSQNRYYVEFAKHLIKKYIDSVSTLETLLLANNQQKGDKK